MCATKGLWVCGLSDGFSGTGGPSLYFCGKCWRQDESRGWRGGSEGGEMIGHGEGGEGRGGRGWSQFHSAALTSPFCWFCCKIHDVFLSSGTHHWKICFWTRRAAAYLQFGVRQLHLQPGQLLCLGPNVAPLVFDKADTSDSLRNVQKKKECID